MITITTLRSAQDLARTASGPVSVLYNPGTWHIPARLTFSLDEYGYLHMDFSTSVFQPLNAADMR